MIGPKFYAWDRNGKPLAFGKLYTYQARTNYPKATYNTEDQITENTNPIILNGEGYADVYLDGAYKMVLKDKNDTEIWTSDPVTGEQLGEWSVCLAASYVSPSSIIVSGNFSAKYKPGGRVRVDNGTSSYSYANILTSSFAGGETTIELSSPVVSTGVSGVCVSSVTQDSIPDSNPGNVNELKAFGYSQGQEIKTKGYYVAGDGGGASYLIKTVSQAASDDDVIDGYGNHLMSNGCVAILQAGKTLMPARFGLKGGGNNDSQAFIAMKNIAIKKKAEIAIIGEFYSILPDILSLSDGENLKITGLDRENSGIKAYGAGDNMITLAETSMLSMSNLSLNASEFDCGLIRGSATGSGFVGVSADGCYFDCSGSATKHGIFLSGNLKNVVITNNIFQGSLTPSRVGALYQLQRLLSVPDDGTDSDDTNLIVVKYNTFKNGATQFSTFGTAQAISPLHVVGNTFLDAECRSMHLYHSEESLISKNLIKGCKGRRPTIADNNIGGAVWLDLYSPLVDGSRNSSIYSDNIVKKCNGVGIFVEEFSGTLSGWSVLETGIFLDGFIYDNSNGFATTGGFGFVVTGGSKRFTLACRADGNVTGVVIDRSLGIAPTLQIGVVTILGSHIDENKEHGVLIRNQVRMFQMIGGTCLGNGKSSSGNYDAIHITRDSLDSITSFEVKDVVFDDESTTVASRHCINKTYAGGYGDIQSNRLNSLSEWVNSGGTFVGQIENNNCIGSRGFLLSGSERWYRNNRGYKTEEYANLLVTNGFAEYTHTLSASADMAFVAVKDSSTTPVIIASNVLSSKVSVRLYDSGGSLLNVDKNVSIKVMTSKSLG